MTIAAMVVMIVRLDQITSTSHLSDSSYVYMSGTSMAAPLVSGAAALILKNKRLSPSQVEETLTTSAIKYKSLEGFVQHGIIWI